MTDMASRSLTTFGDLLRHLRQRAQLTQDELGIAVGYSRAHVARLESNQRAPDVAAVQARFPEALHLQEDSKSALQLIQLAVAAREISGDAVASADVPQVELPQSSISIPNNLPAPLTSFIGRAHELVELARLLPTTRLLSLTGSGGVGKTRLALALAAQVMHAYPDGVWLAELASLSDPAALPQLLLGVLGLHEELNRPALATFIDALQPKRVLLILDNCEHLIEACAHLAEAVLRSCAQVTILATSRESLGIGGELTWRVPSLQTPDSKTSLALTELAGYEAVRLFVDRAGLAAPGFVLTEANTRAVHHICVQLDGIPLAIELAAACVKVLAPEDVVLRLSDQFRLLTRGSRTALPRHQTLRAMIDWSYQLLTDTEQMVFRRLAVFVGGWTIEAAQMVCQSSMLAAQDVLALLMRLVDKSLVVMSQHEGVTRYHLLETIRQYAAEKLEDAGERHVVRDRHLDYFLTLGERERPLLFGLIPVEDQGRLLKQLARDLDNVRRAGGWAEEMGQIEKGLRLIMAMSSVFLVRAGQKEVITRLQTLLKHPAAAQNTRAEALAYLEIASFQIRQNELELSLASLEKAEAVTFAPDDPRMRADILGGRAQCAREQGDYALARSYLEQWRAFSLAHDHLGRDPEEFASETAFNYGILLWLEGEYAQAKVCLMQAYEWNSKRGHKINTTAVARWLGYVSLSSGEVAAAAEWFRESLTDNFALGDLLAVAACLAACGAYALAQEVPHAAACLFGATERLQTLLNTPLLPWDARQFQRNVAVLRQQLGPVELEASWLAGRAMTLDQAVEYALSCCVHEPQ